MRLFTRINTAVLVALSVRRAVFLAAAILPARHEVRDGTHPTVAILVPANDEETTLGRLLNSIERLDWPADRLRVALVDDGSDDNTWELIERWVEANENAVAVRLAARSGKSSALNAALDAAGPADIAVVCDADIRLAPDYLVRLLPAFRDPSVGAAAGFITAANPDASMVARYAALETWVHQLVTGAAKDRLGLNPATYAGSAYRRAALDAIGGFASERAGDDVEAAAALTRMGWRTRFVCAANADQMVVERSDDYWRQHLRWGRNVRDAGRGPSSASSVPRRRLVELVISGIGYGDRIAFVAAVILAARRRGSPSLPAAYALLRALDSVVAVIKAGKGRRLPAYTAAAAIVLPLDFAASVAGVVGVRSPVAPAWRGPSRSASLE